MTVHALDRWGVYVVVPGTMWQRSLGMFSTEALDPVILFDLNQKSALFFILSLIYVFQGGVRKIKHKVSK